LLLLADATISLIPPTAPVSEAAGEVIMCCARLTGLPTGGLGCPLVADLILTDGAKAGMLYSKARCMHQLMVSKLRSACFIFSVVF